MLTYLMIKHPANDEDLSYKLLIAPWGNPFTWKEANYRLWDKITREVTTLSSLTEHFNPDKTLIFIPETLLCQRSRSYESYKRYAKDKATLDDYPKEKLLSNSFSAYKDLLSSLAGAVGEFCRENISGGRGIDVVITPNVGEYGCNKGVARWKLGSRQVSPDSAYSSYVLSSILYSMESILGIRDVERISIILDTTHGINYMPLAAYKAAITASRIISAAYGVDVKFEQYNSTPYPVGIGDVIPDLEVYLVKSEYITPVKAAQRIVYSYLASERIDHLIIFSDKADVSKMSSLLDVRGSLSVLKAIHNFARPLVSSIHYSMPLAFLQFSCDFNSHEKPDLRKIHEILMDLLSFVRIWPDEKRSENGIMEIEHLAIPNYEELKSSFSAYALILYGRRALDEAHISAVKDGRIEAPLSELMATVNKYLKGPLAGVTEQEISNFKNNVDKYLSISAEETTGEWISHKGPCEIHTRNFIAHSGLDYNALELMRSDNEIWVRYRRECFKEIRRIAGRALKETRRLIVGKEFD